MREDIKEIVAKMKAKTSAELAALRACPELRQEILEFLPIDIDYPVSVVSGYIRQHRVGSKLFDVPGFGKVAFDLMSRPEQYRVTKTILDSLVRDGLVERAYGSGVFGGQALTYNRKRTT